MSSRAERVSIMNGHSAGFGFSIRCLMKEKPIQLCAYNLVISVLMFGYSIRIFDQALDDPSKQDFSNMRNPFWLSIVTMTTVGYGDFYPKSYISRVIGIICSFYGVYIVSLFVVTQVNFLEMTKSEERAYNLIETLETKDQLLKKANNVIVAGYKSKKMKESNPESKFKINQSEKTFRLRMNTFQKSLKWLKGQQ